MPRGVYQRKKRKSKRNNAQSTREAATGFRKTNTSITILLPAVTIDRLMRHAEKQGKAWEWLVTKAIYDMLPVEYEVDGQFVFNWGKYEGETAASVKQLDPAYIDWARRSITGFKLVGDMAERQAVGASTSDYVSIAEINTMLRPGEKLKINRTKCWADNNGVWGPARWRLLAVRANECAPWVKVGQ